MVDLAILVGRYFKFSLGKINIGIYSDNVNREVLSKCRSVMTNIGRSF